MSGLEVVGALASASQLAGQVLNVLSFISDLYVKIRDAPESIQRQVVQAEQLHSIARLIERNPSLQTDAIALILQSCRSEAQSLLDILSKILVNVHDGKAKKLWKAIDRITKERTILGCLSRLEREKSILGLHIMSIDSALLHKIHLDLVTVKTGIDELSNELPGIRDTARNVNTIIEGLPSLTSGITDINKTLPNLNNSVTTVHGEPADVNLNGTATHDMPPAMRDAIQHSSIKPQQPNTDKAGVDRSISQPTKNKRAFHPAQSAQTARPGTSDYSLDSFIKSFHHYDYVYDFERTFKGKYKGTCQWISKNAKFTEWYLSEPEGCNILWVYGAPGLGKSTLLTYVVQSIMDQRIGDWRISLSSLSKPTVIYSFCNSQTNNTASLVMSVAIHQLLIRFPRIVQSGYDFNKSRSTNPKRGDDDAISLKRKSPKQLWTLFQHLAKESKANIIFVVDGLDECDRNSQQALLEVLIQTAGNIKILLSSRPNEQLKITLSRGLDISKGILKYLNTQEEQRHINNDIDRYVQIEISRISHQRGYSKSQKLEILEVLKNDRSGLFLPVVLMLKRLEVTPATHLTSILKDSAKLLAEDLDHIYDKLLREMPDSIRSQPSAVFKYLMYARSPLTVRDLALACSSKYDGSQDERNPILSDSFIFSFRCDLNLYGPILRVRQDDVVEFIHSSAKEYLLVLSQALPSSVKFLTPQIQAHREIAIDCLEILISNSSLPLEPPWGRWRDNEKIIDKKILLPYALQHWYEHLRDATSHFTSVETIDRAIFLLVRELANLWLNNSTRSFRRILLERCGFYVIHEREDRTSALQVFSGLGLSLFVENLLATRVYSLTPYVKAALALAIKGGHEPTVDILTNYFKIALLEGPEFKTAIDDAARSGQQNLLRKMVRMRKQEASEYASALVGAFSSGKKEILDTLTCEMGNFETRDLLGLTVIHRLFANTFSVRLASQTTLAIAQYLVSCGADIDNQDRWGNTALHYACQSPDLSNPEVIEGLLMLDADPWRRNMYGWTPFHLAARYTKHPSSIKILLQYGRPGLIEAKTNSGRTPLGFACQRHCASLDYNDYHVVQTLALLGANINAIGPGPRKQWDLTERCIDSSNFRTLDTSLTGSPANASTDVSSLADMAVVSVTSASTSPYTLVSGPANFFRRRTPIAVPFDGDSDTESNLSYITAPESS